MNRTASVKKIEDFRQLIVLEDGTEIAMKHIVRISDVPEGIQ